MDIIFVCSLILFIIMYISKVLHFSYLFAFYFTLYFTIVLEIFFLPKRISNQNLNRTSMKRRKPFLHNSKGKIDGTDTQVGGPSTQLLM